MKRRYLYDSSSALHIACYSSRDAESRERERENFPGTTQDDMLTG